MCKVLLLHVAVVVFADVEVQPGARHVAGRVFHVIFVADCS